MKMVHKKSLQFIAIVAIFFNGFALYAKDKASIIIRQEISIDAPTEKSWEVLGPQFENAQVWATSVTRSEALDRESLNGSTCTIRGCSIAGMGDVKEKLLTYSPEDHSLSYVVTDGMPKMVRYLSNSWVLIDLGNGKSKLEMTIEMKTGGFMGWMMGGMMKRKLTKLSAEVAEEFKYYVENGKPHPRKIKSTNK